MSNGANSSTEVAMVDTSVIGAIMRGNARVAQDLEQLRARGVKIVIIAGAYAEIRKTPNVVTRAVQLALIQELGLEVQEAVSLTKRFAVYGGPDPRSPNSPNNRNVPAGWINLKMSNVGQSDLTIISDVWAYQQSDKGQGRRVTFWTVERMARQQPSIQQQYGITFSPLSRVEPQGPFVDAKQVFALFPSLKGRFKVTADGRIVRTFWSGKAGTTIKVGAIIVGGLAFRGLLGYFAAKIYARYAQKALDEQFEKIRPQIEKDLRSRKEEALNLVAEGLEAYATTTIKIWSVTDAATGQGTSMPVVEYQGLMISTTKTELHMTDRSHLLAVSTDRDIYMTSTPITFDKDFVELYQEYQKAVAWYQRRIDAILLGGRYEGRVYEARRAEERKSLEQDLKHMTSEMKSLLQQ